MASERPELGYGYLCPICKAHNLGNIQRMKDLGALMQHGVSVHSILLSDEMGDFSK